MIIQTINKITNKVNIYLESCVSIFNSSRCQKSKKTRLNYVVDSFELCCGRCNSFINQCNGTLFCVMYIVKIYFSNKDNNIGASHNRPRY